MNETIKNLIELLDFYQHHLHQMDKLARVNALLKKENRLLRKKLNLDCSKEKEDKPRIVCKGI